MCDIRNSCGNRAHPAVVDDIFALLLNTVLVRQLIVVCNRDGLIVEITHLRVMESYRTASLFKVVHNRFKFLAPECIEHQAPQCQQALPVRAEPCGVTCRLFLKRIMIRHRKLRTSLEAGRQYCKIDSSSVFFLRRHGDLDTSLVGQLVVVVTVPTHSQKTA